MTMTATNLKWFVTAALLSVHVGCTTPFAASKNDQTDDVPIASVENPVFQIVSMWQPTKGLGLDGQDSRGFSGQILFFTQQNPVPVQVNGTVSVVLFEDHGIPLDQDKPIHEFNFAPEAWNIYMRKTALDPIYGVFIPYPVPGDQPEKCHLLVRLSSKNGPAISSKTTAVFLPAKPN